MRRYVLTLSLLFTSSLAGCNMQPAETSSSERQMIQPENNTLHKDGVGYENEKGEWVGDTHPIEGPPPDIVRFPELNKDGNELMPMSEIYTWNTSPVPIIREGVKSFTLPDGRTQYYEAIYMPEGGINWVQAKALAEQAGGYLATIHSKEENEFTFNLVTHPKYWYAFDHGNNLFVLSGPFLGGFQAQGASEPEGDWQWVSGEPFTYSNWQKEGLPIGIKSLPDNQPNNSRDSQHVMAFGEVDVPVSYWSDVPHGMGTFGTPLPPAHGFIIEYDKAP